MFEILAALPRELLDDLVGWIQDLVNWGLDLGRRLVQAIADGIRGAGSALAGALGDVVSNAAGNIPLIGGLVQDIIPFAEGGLVTGPTIGLLGEAGPEVVYPLSALDQMRPVVIHNHFTISDTLDSPETVGARVEEILTRRAAHKGGLDFVDAS